MAARQQHRNGISIGVSGRNQWRSEIESGEMAA